MVILATPVAPSAWLSDSAVMLSPKASKDRGCDETRSATVRRRGLTNGKRAAKARRTRMSDTAATAQVIIRPPLAWALAVIAAFALDWLMPLPFVPAAVPAPWLGGAVFVVALALFAWAIATITRAGSNVPTNMPTTSIVDTGPYRFTRNPIYLGMMLGLDRSRHCLRQPLAAGDAVPFALVIRYGVVAREEAYLERTFGEVYRRYRARVRRWL